VAEQVAAIQELASGHGGTQFLWADKPEERTELWTARHKAYFACLALRPGCRGITTDVCVPIALILIDPNNPEEVARAEALNEAIVATALRLEGTCTGEHGQNR